MDEVCIVWFRQDLRLEDNPAFYHAAKSDLSVLPLYIWDDDSEAHWSMGSASKVWLHHSLLALQDSLKKIGSDLVILKGNSRNVFEELIKQYSIASIVWNRRYEPAIIKRDTQLKTYFIECGIEAKSFNGSLLYEPQKILNKQGLPYKVYTAFWNSTQAMSPPDLPLAKSKPKTDLKKKPKSLTVMQLSLLPKIQWHLGIEQDWQPGETNAKKHLKNFLKSKVVNYGNQRDFPARDGISKLSPYLHFGEISPNTIWHALLEKFDGNAVPTPAVVYLKQLVWREFAHYLLFHFPHTDKKPLREEFQKFPWQKNKKYLVAWQNGETGYPIVDAGMRELWQTGWMHNRVRMIVASFLIKDCLIHWKEGAQWFWDTLVDADLANNTMGWQWVAGSGADAAPYFRIFNPITQGERFDPDGEYIRKWIPELGGLTNEVIHKPWLANTMDLQLANIHLGKDYPKPLLDHSDARKIALDALKQMKTDS